MLRNRVFYVLLLLIMAMIYVFTNTYYTLTLLGLCVVLPLISLVLMFFSRMGLSIALSVPRTVEKAGAVFTYRFENKSVLPVARVALQVCVENQMTGSSLTKKIQATVGGKKIVEARLSMENSKVGTVILSTGKIRVYDAFGLFTIKKANLPDRMTVVYPDVRDVAVYMEKPIETTGDGSRYAPDRPGRDVSEIFSLREYTPGDEVRKIHWKLSSKIDKTVVRDFSLPLNYSVFLLMELTRGSEAAVDAVVELYLSISRALLENGINHNLAWYDAGEGAFHVRELDDFEDLEMAAAQVLASYAGDKTGVALDYYAAGSYRNPKSTLVYVASRLDLDKIAELEVSQVMRTVYVYEEENQEAGKEAEQAVELIPIPAARAAEGIPEIMV